MAFAKLVAMTLWWHGIVVDARDPHALARFWAGALGWVISVELDDEVVVEAPEDRPPALVFVRAPAPATHRSRVHLDLRSESTDAQRSTVRRLLDAGARPADVGQGDVPWTVLTDPEGNEFCVLDPRAVYASTGPLAAVVVLCDDPPALASFWRALLAWDVASSSAAGVALRAADGTGAFLEFVPATAPVERGTKNRVHLDVAPAPTGDRDTEVRRAVALGARPVDVGQGDVAWTVLADPEGNPFCVLPPKELAPRPAG